MSQPTAPRSAPRVLARALFLACLGAAGLLLAVPAAEARDPPRAATPVPPMRKVVSTNANFLTYVPTGWTVNEGANAVSWSLAVTDPASGARTLLMHGRSPVGNDVRRLSGAFLDDLRRLPGARFEELRVSRAGDRLYARGAFPAGANRSMTFRSWTAVRGGDFTYVRVQAPPGHYEAHRDVLLSPLVNLIAIPGRFGMVQAQPLPMRTYSFPSGAGTCLVPQGWSVTPYGGHFMVATDPAQQYGFFIGYDEAVTPRSGIRSGYVATSNYLLPHQAAIFFARHKRLGTNIRMEQVNPQVALTQQAMALYRGGGRANVEDFTYTFDSRGRRYRGFTVGLTGMPTLGLNWGYTAMTVIAPVEAFGTLAATFAKMMGSYRINDRYAAAYVEAGRRRVQQMVARTIQIIQRNRAEIQQMMNAAYQERQISQDYINYQRSRYIRGESDWISAREGGTVYRSDRWGIENRTSGGRMDGQPVNYFNFRGGAGGYGDLVEINSRELWQRAYGQ